MSDNKDVVVLDEEQPKVKAPAPPKPEPKVDKPAEPTAKLGKPFFDRFNGKAPHYKLAGTFHIHDITKEDADNCRLFDSWIKPKRLGLTVEWAEEMRRLGKLFRFEKTWEE